eukprot:COSAG06_NODE_53070_length_302_cov_0.758621_1_plen_85_part_01
MLPHKQVVASSSSDYDMLAGSESVSSQAPIWAVMLSRRPGEKGATGHTRMQHLGFGLAGKAAAAEPQPQRSVRDLKSGLKGKIRR